MVVLLGKMQAANGVTTSSRPVAKTRHAAKALTSVLALEHERRQRQAVCWLLTLFGTQGDFNVPIATPQVTQATDINLDACSFLVAGEEPSAAARRARPRKQNRARFVSILIRDLAAMTGMLRERCASEHPHTLAVPSLQLHALAVPLSLIHI